jgi:hypothetical protein
MLRLLTRTYRRSILFRLILILSAKEPNQAIKTVGLDIAQVNVAI